MSNNRLLDLSMRFDGVIQKLKASYIDLRVKPNWMLWLLLSPIRDLTKIGDIKEGFVKFLSSGVMLSLIPIFSFILGPIALGSLSMSPIMQNIVGALLGYLFSLFFYWKQMLDFNSVHFHLGAYQKFRKQEYELLYAAFLDDKEEFYFKGLYDKINKTTATYEMVNNRLNEFLQNEKAEYKKEIALYNERVETFETFNENLIKKVEVALESSMVENRLYMRYIRSLEGILNRVSKIFSRMAYDRFTINDLNILGGFLIYEYKVGNNYISLLADVDTHSKSKDKIFLSEDTGQTNLIRQQSKMEYATFTKKLTNVSYVEDSFLMDMGNDIQWIYSFHSDASDEFTLQLLTDNDMLNLIELHTLIHSICLMLNKVEIEHERGG